MTHIVEYLGKEGVRSTPYDHHRIAHPKAGDLVEWPNGKIGRLETRFDPNRPKAYVDEPGDWLTCCEMGSAFLGWAEERDEPYLSISGGPFITINERDLQSHGLHVARFWNWGDNDIGAHQGVEYLIVRPLYRYTGTSTHYSIRKETA